MCKPLRFMKKYQNNVGTHSKSLCLDFYTTHAGCQSAACVFDEYDFLLQVRRRDPVTEVDAQLV
ncbi:hypothetical protein LAD12857_00960 [Lacrimispora amygdalina]|uniref:Uncharacterized protein n=1 Tax=Lacrimispora amygdalina TaxID=253257 RepID=A0ABQ5LZJ4_9FIRM